MNSHRVHVYLDSLKLHWDKPEDLMKRVMTAALIAGGLMLVNAPQAEAHDRGHDRYEPRAYYYADVRRPRHMPRWLKHDRSFRRWYKRSALRRDRRLDWYELFEIYRWERYAYRSHHRRYDYYRGYDRHRYERYDGRRHRH